MYTLSTNMYLLKRYRPSDSFCTFISESGTLCDAAGFEDVYAGAE